MNNEYRWTISKIIVFCEQNSSRRHDCWLCYRYALGSRKVKVTVSYHGHIYKIKNGHQDDRENSFIIKYGWLIGYLQSADHRIDGHFVISNTGSLCQHYHKFAG